MTQEPRTTESQTRDNAAIREIMHSIKELTVPDRATLALGLVGHLATLMNGRQIEKLMAQLTEEAAKVQDVPPSRQGGSAARGVETNAPPVGQSGRGAIAETELL